MQGCAYNASCQTNPGAACPTSIRYLGWNPVQGGNRCNIGSGAEWINAAPGILEAGIIPLFWNPDWDKTDCSGDGCGDNTLKHRESDVFYTQRLRFVRSHIVEMQMTVENQTSVARAPAGQEFPTLYAVWGDSGTANLRVLLDSTGTQIPIDVPANDGFFMKDFDSPGGWVALENDSRDYGVGIYYENRLTTFQGWQKSGVFNNVRSRWAFGIPANGTVRARAYLMLGSFQTIAGLAADLDAALPPFGVLDSPTLDQQLSGSMAVRGWVLDNKGVTELKLLIDGQEHDTLSVSSSRPDVCTVYPGYTMCDTVGYDKDVSLTGLSKCAHLLEIEAADNDGNRRVIARTRILVN
jgi:hypothetical protein